MKLFTRSDPDRNWTSSSSSLCWLVTERQKGPCGPRTRHLGIPGISSVLWSLHTELQTRNLPTSPKPHTSFCRASTGPISGIISCLLPVRTPLRNPTWKHIALLFPVQCTPAMAECLNICRAVSATFLQYLNPAAIPENAFLNCSGLEVDLLNDILIRSSYCQHRSLAPAACLAYKQHPSEFVCISNPT